MKLDKGIIDSTGILELTVYLEETFGVEIEDEEMVPENLDSIIKIIKYDKHFHYELFLNVHIYVDDVDKHRYTIICKYDFVF